MDRRHRTVAAYRWCMAEHAQASRELIFAHKPNADPGEGAGGIIYLPPSPGSICYCSVVSAGWCCGCLEHDECDEDEGEHSEGDGGPARYGAQGFGGALLCFCAVLLGV